jgi:hypothetical protein
VQVMRKNLSESYEKNTYLEGQYLRLMKEHAALIAVTAATQR